MRFTVVHQGFEAHYHDDDGSGEGMVHVYKDGVDLGLGTFCAPFPGCDGHWNDAGSFESVVPDDVLDALEALILAELAP